MQKKKTQDHEIPFDYEQVKKSADELLSFGTSKIQNNFWRNIFRDINDIYSLSTALYVFVVILPIIISEIRRAETEFVTLTIGGMSLKMPMALQIVLISILLTTLVNYFRMILNLAISWVKKKLGDEYEFQKIKR